MINQRFVTLITLCSIIFSSSVTASSLYLPLDNRVRDLVEKLNVITNLPTTKKIYPLKLLLRYNEKIKDSHPWLHKIILEEIQQLQSNSIIKERLNVFVSLTNEVSRTNPNSNGQDPSSFFFLEAAYFFNLNPHFQFSFNLNAYEKGDQKKITSNNTYLSFGWDFFQIDIGYRDHWFSPFYDSSFLISTNAENSPSITFSNNIPIASFKANYEFFFSNLNKTNGISYDNDSISGNPKLFGIHLDFRPVDWLEIGMNRTMQFGGGRKTLYLEDFTKAFGDPVGKDNVVSSKEGEFGNQQASLDFVFNYYWQEVPFQIYYSYAAEDTAKLSNYRVGNLAFAVGLYFPEIFKTYSLRYEFTERQMGWYTHHLYENGYSNEGHVMGHWVGDTRVSGDSVGGQTHYIDFTKQISLLQKIKLFTRIIDHEDYSSFNYSQGYELGVNYIDRMMQQNYDLLFVLGQTTLNEKFYNSTLGLSF